MNTQRVRHVEEMGRELLQTILESVIPIGAHGPDGEPVQVGTGTLFAVGDTHFVVTATHVLDRVDRDGAACAFVPGGEVGEYGTRLNPVPLFGNSHRAPHPVDVAVLALEPESAAGLVGRRFLRLTDACLAPEPLGLGWVWGFPEERIRTVAPGAKAFEPLNMATPILSHDGAGLLDFDPEIHFVLNAAPTGFAWSDGSGPAALPHRFEGISGSSVWQTWWPSRGGPDEQRARMVRVVGIQTSFYRKPALIKATNWGAVVEVIRQALPGLRPVLGWHFGREFGS